MNTNPTSVNTNFDNELVLPPQLTIVGKTAHAELSVETPAEAASIDEPIFSKPDLAAEMNLAYQHSAFAVLLQRKTPLLPLLSDHELAAIVKGTSDLCTPITLPPKPFLVRVWNGYLAMRASLNN